MPGKLTATLVDGKRIQVKQEGDFTHEAKVALRSVAIEREYHGPTQTWTYPYAPGNLQGLVDISGMLGFELRLDHQLRAQYERVQKATEHEGQIRKFVQAFLDNPAAPVADFPTQPVPPPWRHQKIAWHWMMRVRCLYVASKPGTGKTRIASDIIRGKYSMNEVRAPEHIELPARPSAVDPTRMLPARWGTRGGVLVTCPGIVLGEWMDQLDRWQNIKAIPITGSSVQIKRRRAGTRAWVHICSYDSLELVEGNEYDGIIGDELHYVANQESNRFQRMMALRSKVMWALGMSGTPISNMLPSLWAQYYWLDGGRTLGPSFEAFKRRYFTKEGWGLEEKVDTETRVSRAIARITLFLTMEQCFPGKPRKIHQVLRIPLTKDQQTYYELLRERAAAEIQGGKVSLVETTTRLLKLLQVTQGFVFDDERHVQQFSSAKLNALEEMLTDGGDLTDRRVIVWCRFRPDLDKVSQMLARHGIDHMQLHGDLSEKEKHQLRDTWNSTATKRVLVGMLQMGIGINLHAPTCVDANGKPARCSTTVFYGLDYRVTQLEQAMDRVYRGDQVESCLYRYLLSDTLDNDGDEASRKPIDVRIYEILQEKLDQGVRVNEEGVDYVRRLLSM